MAKVSFDSIPSINIQPIACEFASVRLVEPIRMTLKPLTSFQQDAVSAKVRDLAKRFIYGGWFNDSKEYVEKPEVVLVDNVPVALSEDSLFLLVRAEMMQAGPVSERYTFEELVQMAVKLEDAWDALILKLNKIQASYEPGKDWAGFSDQALSS